MVDVGGSTSILRPAQVSANLSGSDINNQPNLG